MSAIGNVVIAIKAVDEASSVMDSIRVGLAGFSTTLSQLGPGFSQLGSVLTGFASGGVLGAAVAGVGQLVTGLKDCVKEAMDAEDVWNRLKTTVENSGTAWSTVGDQVKKFAEGMMNMSRFSDEQVASAMKTLIDYGMDLNTAMTSMAATMDLAAAKQVPLAEAATAVGKAFSGQEGILTRMGIVIDKTVPEAERFAAAMGLISSKFGGAAQADLDTYAGKWTQFTNKWTELMEKIGTGLLPVLTKLADVLIVIVDSVTAFVDSIQKILGGFYDWLVGKSFLQDLVTLVIDVATGGLVSLLKMVVGNLDSIMSTFSDWGKTVQDFFGNMWNSVVDSAVGAFNRICDAVRSAINAITGLFNDLWNALTKHSIWTDMWKDMILQTEAGLGQILSETQRSVGSFESMFAGTAGGLSVQGTERSPGYAAGSAALTGPTHMTVPITITVQHMTGEVKDLENLTRMICRELGSTVKWRV
jgi:hypothetical protein